MFLGHNMLPKRVQQHPRIAFCQKYLFFLFKLQLSKGICDGGFFWFGFLSFNGFPCHSLFVISIEVQSVGQGLMQKGNEGKEVKSFIRLPCSFWGSVLLHKLFLVRRILSIKISSEKDEILHQRRPWSAQNLCSV